MNENRRLQERKLPEQIVLCKLGGQESSSVLNLSEDGLCFESLTPIDETDLLQLRLSADLESPIEATGRLAWIDSAKRTGGLRFLELSASAREQIRAWLSETSAASGSESVDAFLQQRDKQADDRAAPDKPAPRKPATDKLVIWRETRAPSTQLVPIARHQAGTRSHFLFGILIGFGIGTAVITLTFRYAVGTKPGGLARTAASANRSAQSSAQQTQASEAQPVLPGASASERIAWKPLATVPPAVQTVAVAAPARSPQKQNQSQSQAQSPPSARASSTGLLVGTPPPSAILPPATPADRVASSRPRAKSEPLGPSQAAVAPAPDASEPNSSAGPREREVEGLVEGPAERPIEHQVQNPKKAPPTPEQLWSALQKGNMKAAVALADLYTRGEGVPVNCQQARVLLQVASEKHSAEASKKLQELDNAGCPANTANE